MHLPPVPSKSDRLLSIESSILTELRALRSEVAVQLRSIRKEVAEEIGGLRGDIRALTVVMRTYGVAVKEPRSVYREKQPTLNEMFRDQIEGKTVPAPPSFDEDE